MNRRSPEIIEKDVFDRSMRPQIPVVFNGTNVIKNESTVQTVVIADNACDDDDQTEPRLHAHARSSADKMRNQSIPKSNIYKSNNKKT